MMLGSGRMAAVGLALALTPPWTPPRILEHSVLIGDDRVSYTVILPDDYPDGREYPAIVAFPPGSQLADMVDFSVENIWRREAEARGYLVFIPEAPGGDWFFQRGDRVFPALLDHFLDQYPVRPGGLHVAGPSNGGRSALHVAADHPSYFSTVTVFPGYLPTRVGAGDSPPESEPARFRDLEGLCIRMYVGGRDQPWRDMMEPQANAMQASGLDVTLTVEEDQGHLPASLVRENAHRLFETIEACASNRG